MDTTTQRRRGIGRFDAGFALGPQHGGNDQMYGRVLIVDDDAAMRLICEVNLAAEGLQVLEAENGLAALEQARDERPDLVLTDVKMPGLDGFELAERLRRAERTRRIPLIFLSGEVGQENVERARALGALAYLTKPFDPCRLASFVARELVALRAGSPELAAAVS